MSNLTTIIGKIATINEDNVIIAVNRNYKNENGLYETDFIPVNIMKSMINNIKDYCDKGDLMAIRGRIEMIDNKINIIAEKVSFLSKGKKDEIIKT